MNQKTIFHETFVVPTLNTSEDCVTADKKKNPLNKQKVFFDNLWIT